MAIEVDPSAVRAALDPTLESDVLPDATVQLDIYMGRASDMVEQWNIDLGLGLTDDDTHMQRAATLQTAALIAPSLPVYVRESVPDYTEQRGPTDRSGQQSDLSAQAYAVLSDLAYQQTGEHPDWVASFQRAQGTRFPGQPSGRRAEGAFWMVR
jgi:hypothetical protein